MDTFFLSQLPPTARHGKDPIPGRVILDYEPHGAILSAIEAEAITKQVNGVTVIIKSAWRNAREKVKESDFYHFENEGWFPRKQEKAA